ncbi:EamA family transporter RarD [Sphingomonas endophytica]|uniref:Membrane protein n=1 Tax=Sphingomonas endophytica TaxID=869719 RepID=A0A147I4H9_9SPHN|nr:EamA family transporter RarD [Sphingomonas endophytica]KTT73074.1 membrane protein [Sphingomonas endophytica]
MVNHATRTGLILGIGAYTLWGLLPLYLHLLSGVPAVQVLAHRVLWSLVLLAAIVVAIRRGGAILAAARGRTLALLVASAALIAVNWMVYIWAVQNGHVLEASLGYFINPLVNVALGMIILGERIGTIQKAAVAVAAIGVAVMAVAGGGALWIPLTLAFSFGFYGLIRKVAAIDALGGLTVETALLAAPALAVLFCSPEPVFGRGVTTDTLLVLAGAVTAAPLLMFAAAARRLRYATMGLLQYIAPTLQFLEAVVLFREPLRPVHMVTFALIWSGCVLYALGSRTPVTRPDRAAAPAKPSSPDPS